jgi:PAT family beta-lactamase induction signal transducer AmpG
MLENQIEKPSLWRVLLSWKMLAMFSLGLISGFPFYVVKDVLKAWMTSEGIDLGTIGLMSAVSLPYTLKFIWSPALDGIVPPFLGRRRGWMLLTQIALLGTIALLGQWNPQTQLAWIGLTAMAVSFFGATQDIALDAFRREYLREDELGLGTGVWMNAWRLGMYVTVGVSFLSADAGVGWDQIHILLGLMMLIGVITTLLVSEPKVEEAPPRSIREAVIDPFKEFLSRNGAFWILAFVLLYKVGDNLAGALNIPFILSQGFTRTEYFVVVKGLGMFCMFGGALLGGAILVRMKVSTALWSFGILQMISTAAFALLVLIDHESAFWSEYRQMILAGIVSFEFLATGLGQAAYATFMALQTNKKFTATQYALLTSLMAVPGTIFASGTGYLAESVGWTGFYLFCALAALPGLLMIPKVSR